MADNKYGSIYTEDDLKMIVERCMESDIQGEDELMVVIESLRLQDQLKFMHDEPLFLLRGKDRLALSAVRCYLERCENSQYVSSAHIDSVVSAVRSFEDFRAAFPEALDFPD
jgi:hypothetical protein